MYFLLIALFLGYAILLLLRAFSYRNGGKQLIPQGDLSSDERTYWKEMTAKQKKGFLIGAVGAVLAAASVALKRALPAEIGCITLLGAMVYTLAILCRKTPFPPSAPTEKLQKRWKIILLIGAFLGLILTQFVFGYFNSL